MLIAVRDGPSIPTQLRALAPVGGRARGLLSPAAVLERIVHLVVAALARLMYRLRARGLQHIPAQGPCVVVCNHVSFIDALVLSAFVVRRPIRFVIDHRMARLPGLGWFFRIAGVIPIAPAHEDPELLARAYERIAERLGAGEIVGIFPEGKITRTGDLEPFRAGVEQIVARTPVPVVPVALRGLWGSFFSRKDGEAMRKWPRRFRARVELHVGTPHAAAEVRAPTLQAAVAELRGAVA
jgi:1-acyl-sn-glycerol-3-phosphate acyltransferase